MPGLKLPLVTDLGAGQQTLETKLGLDLKGGYSIVYQAQPDKTGRMPNSDELNVMKTIMENRVNSQGVAEPVVETEGTDRIRVSLPGISNADAILKLVGQTGTLEFVPLPSTADKYGTSSSPGKLVAQDNKPLPSNETPLFDGKSIDPTKTYPCIDQKQGGWGVCFQLQDPGKSLFGQWTTAHQGEFFAIVLDNNVVSAPYVSAAITDGSGIISGGGFTAQSAKDLATILQYGALPFSVRTAGEQSIPASLGQTFLQQTLLAGAIGIGLVLVFMLVLYRLPGLIANVALTYYALVVLALFRVVPVTLTLAGIAGFVLSVGMAVDANILIFERTKEELRVGKTLPAAIEAGFNRAWNSILDSNVSSLITASILYVFGSSTIRGFALVLIIGVLTSMFTAITVSRTLLRFVVQQDWARRAWLFGVSDEEFQGRAVTRRTGRREVPSRV